MNKKNQIKVPNMISENWKKFYYISTYLLALIAIAGFICSIDSSRKTAKYLNELETNLNNFIQPNVKLETLKWLGGPSPFSCQSPPYGVNVEYANKSLIPIKLIKPKFDIFIDEICITRDNLGLFEIDTINVLVSGETIGFTVMCPIDFKNYLSIKHNMFQAPFLKFRFSALLMTLTENKKYKIEIIDNVGIDCSNFNLPNTTNVKSSYVPFK